MQHSQAPNSLTARFRKEEHNGRKNHRNQAGIPASKCVATWNYVAWVSVRGNGDCVYSESSFSRCWLGTSRPGCGYRACDYGSLGENLPRASCLWNPGQRPLANGWTRREPPGSFRLPDWGRGNDRVLHDCNFSFLHIYK